MNFSWYTKHGVVNVPWIILWYVKEWKIGRVNAKGYLSKNYKFGGIDEQKRRLEGDGIEVTNYRVDLRKYKM